MIPSSQLCLASDGKIGDCMRACIASVLELPTEAVPHFVEEHGEAWFIHAYNWLEARGYGILKVLGDFFRQGEYWKLELQTVLWAEGIPCIAVGASPRVDRNGDAMRHAVVWLNGKLAHDPHPSGDGIVGSPEFFLFLIKK